MTDDVVGRLAKGSRFIVLEEGDHSLVAHAEVIRQAIEEAASEAAS